MPRNIERDKREADRRKNQLIEAGFRLFSQNGIETVSLQKVADAANVSPATMYKYFLTKEKLLIAISAKVWDEVWQAPLRGRYQGKAFRIFKLRTMYKGADKMGGTTALNDPRITRTGKALRKLKLDELPQVYNVLWGSMSFIGPRPELLRYTEAYKGEEKIILEVRPGITDFSSIEFISIDEIVGAENADEMYEKYVLEKKNKLRIRYVKEVSFGTDVSLFFKTVTAVLKKAMRVVGKSNREK